MVVAMLAAASHELSVNEFTDKKAERLEALAKSFSVNTTSIRKEVEAELAAKAKPKASATAKPTPAAKTAATKASPQSTAKKPAKNPQPSRGPHGPWLPCVHRRTLPC